MQKEIEKKLNSFTNIVIEDLTQKHEDEANKIKKEVNSLINKKETELLHDAYDEIQKEIRSIRKADNEEVLHVEVEARRKLLKTREDIIGDVFSQVRDRLREFTKTEDYKTWFFKTLKKAYDELGDGEKSVIVSSIDKGFEDEIAKPGVTIVYDDNHIVMGGVKVYNLEKKIAVDYTFDTLVDARKNEFLQKGDLAIN